MANLSIEVIKTEATTVPTEKGSYQSLVVTYKNLADGKPDSKKILSFDKDSKAAFKALTGAKDGDQFDVVSEKVGDYWKWKSASMSGKSNGVPNASTTGGYKATASPKSTYETPEERAKRQVFIVRQSSISNAIDTLKTDKKAPSVDEVIAVAKQYEAYVFGTDVVFNTQEVAEAAAFAQLKEPEIT